MGIGTTYMDSLQIKPEPKNDLVNIDIDHKTVKSD